MNILVPETTENGDVLVDIYTRLAGDRILFIHDRIDDRLATDIMATLIVMDSEEPGEKISLFINSEGGDIRSIFMIYDTIQILSSPVETFCVGVASNESVLLLAAGTPGMRHATGNALISPTQILSDGMFLADLSDANSLMDRMRRDNKKFIAALAKSVSKPVKEVMADFEKKKFFTAKQAMAYGLIDAVITRG